MSKRKVSFLNVLKKKVKIWLKFHTRLCFALELIYNLSAGSTVLVRSLRVLALSSVFPSWSCSGRGLGSYGDLLAGLLRASSRPVAVPAPTESQESQAPSKCFIPTVLATWEKTINFYLDLCMEFWVLEFFKNQST